MTRSKTRKSRGAAGPNRSLPRGGFAKVSYQKLDKAGGLIVSRSALEGDVLQLLEMDHSVVVFERNDLTELERTRFTLDRQPGPNRVFDLPDGRHYTPDLRIVLTSGETIYLEVGPWASKSHPEMAARLEAAAAAARNEGTELVLLTEREVRRGPYLNNVIRLAPYLHPVGDAASMAETQAREVLEQTEQPVTVEMAVTLLAARCAAPVAVTTLEEAVMAAIAAGARDGRMLLDLDTAPIDASSSFALSADGATVTRSWLDRVCDGLGVGEAPYSETDAGAEPFTLMRPELTDDGKYESPELARRLLIVRDHLADPSLSLAELADRHKVTVGAVRYYCDRAAGRQQRGPIRRVGEAALVPGRDLDGLRAPQEYRDLVKRLYMGSAKLTVRNVWRNRRLKQLEREMGLKVSYWQIARHIREVLKGDREVLQRRQGVAVLAAAPFSGSPDWYRQITQPMQVVQVDHQTMDLFVKTDDGAVQSRPYFLAAMDVATRCLVAWVVCATEPSEMDYRRLLHMLFSPKNDLIKQLQAQTEMPCHGIPQVILADRGWIYTAHDSRRLMSELGIRVEHAAEFQPTMKAVIERLFRTMNDRFVHRQPGSVKPR